MTLYTLTGSGFNKIQANILKTVLSTKEEIIVVSGKQSVVAISLDDLDKIDGISSPNHIKLDVDGKEPDILSGATQVLKKIDSLLVEIEGKNLKENLESIENLISKSGLKEDKSWRKKGSRRNRLYKRKLN